MKTKVLTMIALSLALSAGVSSCIDDDSSLGGKEPYALSIAGGDAGEMPVVNFNLGNPCIIEPVITYGGDEADLRYEWSVGPYNASTQVKGELEVVSNERNLNHSFAAGGTYYAHLTVTDGRVGQAIDYRININRTFEEGYVLVSNDEAGKPNLAFVKIMTPEEISAGVEQVRMEDCLGRMNEGYDLKTLVNAMVVSGGWPTVTRLAVSQQDKCYFLDPNTFTIIAEMDYTEVFPGFKADVFMNSLVGGPCAYNYQSGKYVHLDLVYMFPYENGMFKGNTFDDFYVEEMNFYGSVYAYTISVDYGKSRASMMNMNTAQFVGRTFEGETILTAFLKDDLSGQPYVLTAGKDDPNRLTLYGLMDDYSGALVEVTKSTLAATDQTAIPPQGTRVCVSRTQFRNFYSIGNKVYVLLAQNGKLSLPDKDQYAIAFGADEEITAMNLNGETDELYVATYNKVTKRGSFYIYDAADVKTDNQGNITPKAVHPDCADRIVSVFYKKRV